MTEERRKFEIERPIGKGGRQPRLWLFWALVWATSFVCSPVQALEPKEVLVVANKVVPQGIELSRYYMKQRNIPLENLIILSVSPDERIHGTDYAVKIAGPVRRWIREKDPFRFIRCLVFMYGVPLKISRPKSPGDTARLRALEAEKATVEGKLEQIEDSESEAAKTLSTELKAVRTKIQVLNRADRGASVDSEMALVLERDYSVVGWIPNPGFMGYRGRRVKGMPQEVLMVSRLDGPTPADVRRIIDDSRYAERKGLSGIAYFDARWPKPKEKKGQGYAFYDQSVHLAAERIRDKGTLPTVINDDGGLFQPGDCPQAALYCGWYSLATYVDAFTWQRGAVGYHIASAECRTLKKPGSTVWCKAMIADGIAATLGPVGEPYVQAFPIPEVFFTLLTEGRLTLAECYAASKPFWSWKMVLLGDPLYRPFGKK